MKKTVKTIIKILLILIILWLIVFGIDYYRCSNLKEPIFVIQSIQDQLGTFDGSEMFSCHCLGYKVYYSRGKQVTYINMSILNKRIVEESLYPIDNGVDKLEAEPYENMEGIMVVTNIIE